VFLPLNRAVYGLLARFWAHLSSPQPIKWRACSRILDRRKQHIQNAMLFWPAPVSATLRKPNWHLMTRKTVMLNLWLGRLDLARSIFCAHNDQWPLLPKTPTFPGTHGQWPGHVTALGARAACHRLDKPAIAKGQGFLTMSKRAAVG